VTVYNIDQDKGISIDVNITDANLLEIGLTNTADSDIEFALFGTVQRFADNTWVDVLTTPFGRDDQPGQPCAIPEPCDIAPSQPILRAGEPAIRYVVQLPALPVGEYRLSLLPVLDVSSESWTVA